MKLGLIGAGNMASALARGIGEPVLVYDVDAAKARAARGRARRRGRGLERRAGRSAPTCSCSATSRSSSTRWPRRWTAARGWSCRSWPPPPPSRSARAYPGASIYRFIPNMPTEVRRGVLCYVPGPASLGGPRGRDPRPDGPRRRGDRARRRAPDRAGNGAHELRAGVHGPRGGELRRGRRRARARSRRRDAHGRRDDGRHRGLPRAARLRRSRSCAPGSRRRAGSPRRA